jgi:predicted MFS family arabinose efflux permease
MVWYVLAANALQQMALLGVFSYLAAHLLHTAQMTVADTVLPLAVAGGGLIVANMAKTSFTLVGN